MAPTRKVEGELVVLRLVVLGSLCIQCYILSVYCTLRKAIRAAANAKGTSHYITPKGQISRTEAAEAFAVFSFCCCFFNLYSLLMAKWRMVYSQQRGFMANFFPIIWGLLALAVATPPAYHLKDCLKSYCGNNSTIRHVWEVQIGQIVLQSIFLLLFVAQYPIRRPSPSLDDPAVCSDRHPEARNDPPKSLYDGSILVVSSTFSDHFKLFLVASTSPLWVLVDICWFWMTICMTTKPFGTPRRSAHVANEFYCMWYFTRIGAPPGLRPGMKYVVNPVRYGLFNSFYGFRFKMWKSKVDKAFSTEESEEYEHDTGKLEKLEEGLAIGRSVSLIRPTIPASIVVVDPRMSLPHPHPPGIAEAAGTARHEMDASPGVSEVAGSVPGYAYPQLPELAHTTGDPLGVSSAASLSSNSSGLRGSGVATTGTPTTRSSVYSPRRYAPAPNPAPAPVPRHVSSPPVSYTPPRGSPARLQGALAPSPVNPLHPTTRSFTSPPVSYTPSPPQVQGEFAPGWSNATPLVRRASSPYIVSPIGPDWNPWGLERR